MLLLQRFRLPHLSHAGSQGFERELLGFPNARHDDQVDSFVQFLGWAREREANEIPIVAPWGLTRPSYWRMGEDYVDRFF
jgi:hypothetical protein